MTGRGVAGGLIPDFGRPVPGSDGRVFLSAEGPRRYLAIPTRLRLRSQPDGRPGLGFTYIRGTHPLLPPTPYALLELRLGTAPPEDAALGAVRRCEPGAVVETVPPVSGWLRWSIAAGGAAGGESPGDSGVESEGGVVPLAWNELGWSRQAIRLTPAQADLLVRSLRHGGLALYASAWVEVVGLPPRIAATAVVDPGRLLRPLARTPGAVRVTWRELAATLLRALDAGEVEVAHRKGQEGAAAANRLVAEALADGLGARYGRWVPPGPGDDEPQLELRWVELLEEEGAGMSWRLTMELGEPLPATRVFHLLLDPLSEARALLGSGSPDALVTSVQVPPLDTGHRTVRVYANLPPHREGVLQVGATLASPPAPPHRVDAIYETIRFQPPEDAGEASLRFAPGELGRFTVTPFMALRWGRGVAQLQGEAIPGEDGLILQPGDFPARFIQVQADPELLELAEVEVIHAREGGSGGELRLLLGPQRTAVALPLPLEAGVGTLELRATPGNGGDPLTVGPVPADSITLGLHSFPGYGLHEVAIHCTGEGEEVVGVDLIPEEEEPGPGTVTTLSFSPQRRERRWTYLATSPFHPGFRWRSHRPGQPPGEGWSDPEPPFHPLRLTVGPRGLRRGPGEGEEG